MILATATTVKSGSTCTAIVNDTPTLMQVVRDLTVAVGDVLLVERHGSQWIAIARVFAAAPGAIDNDAAPTPKPTTTYGTHVVSPVETRSYRSGKWRTDTTDVYQGEYGGYGNHTGTVFYGAKPRSIDGATVTSAKIKVRRQRGGAYSAQATTMRLVTQSTKPGGAPTLTSSTSGPSLAVNATNNGFAIPNSWAQAMVDGTAGGIAFYDAGGSPYVVFAGRGTWSPAFTMTLNWTRG